MSTVRFDRDFPNYEVLAELGRGDTRVFKAQHLPSGDLVVIKEYDLATDVHTLQRFEQESQKMIHINHPNLVRVREVQWAAAMVYVVMDYVEGSDLRTWLREEGCLEVSSTIRLGLQLTGAFRAMHTSQIIHRAIHPEIILYNRLISGELHILLSGFGMANTWTWTDNAGRTLTDQELMTYEYAAPEQFDNPHEVDEAVDFYALGVVLYECITGKVPFVLHPDVGLSQFRQQVLTAPVPAITTASGQALPPSLATLLMCLLVRNPQDRLRNVDQLELLLEQSRVEQLNATWSAPNAPLSKASSNPVLTETPKKAKVDESATGGNKRTSGGVRNWWMEICIVLIAGLAFGFYYRSTHSAPVVPVVEQDSVVSQLPGRSKSVTKSSANSAPIVGDKARDGANNGAADTLNPASTESGHLLKPSADSTLNARPVADSIAVMPPDSTD